MYNPNFSGIPSLTRNFGVQGQSPVNSAASTVASGISAITNIPVLSQHSSLPDIYSYTGVPTKVQ